MQRRGTKVFMPVEESRPSSATGEDAAEVSHGPRSPRTTMSRRAAIARAKLEWEGTVDALASLVCLLDRDGRIVRTNRVVEDWSLGTVHDVIGQDTHVLLHPACTNPACDLDAFMRESLAGAAVRHQAGTRAATGARIARPQPDVPAFARADRPPGAQDRHACRVHRQRHDGAGQGTDRAGAAERHAWKAACAHAPRPWPS